MPDTQEKLTEIYDVQIYGGKQKGKSRRREKQEKRERESKRYMRGRDRRDRERVVFMVPMESEGPGSIVRRLGARAGLPLGGTVLLCGLGN